MTVGSKEYHHYLRVVYFINEAVLLRNATTPTTVRFALQLLGMTCTCARMLTEFRNQGNGFPICLRLITEQSLQIVPYTLCIVQMVSHTAARISLSKSSALSHSYYGLHAAKIQRKVKIKKKN